MANKNSNKTASKSVAKNNGKTSAQKAQAKKKRNDLMTRAFAIGMAVLLLIFTMASALSLFFN